MEREVLDGGVVLVKLAPSDLLSPQALYSEFQELIVMEELKRVLVDLSEVEDATSLMIGALIALHLLAYENLAVLKFTGLCPKIKMLFRMLGVEKVIESHYGRDEVLDEFRPVDGPPGFAE